MSRTNSFTLLVMLLTLGCLVQGENDLGNELDSINELNGTWTLRDSEADDQLDKPTRFDLDVSRIIEMDDMKMYQEPKKIKKITDRCKEEPFSFWCIERRFSDYLAGLLNNEVKIVRREEFEEEREDRTTGIRKRYGVAQEEKKQNLSVGERITKFAREHAVRVKLWPETREARSFGGEY